MEEQVPTELQAPLAIARHLLEAPAKVPEPSGAPVVEEKESTDALSDAKEAATENVSATATRLPAHAMCCGCMYGDCVCIC